MIDLIEEIPILPAKKEKQILKAIVISPPVKEKEMKEPAKENKVSVAANTSINYLMPPQPEAYIKSPRYDFF